MYPTSADAAREMLDRALEYLICTEGYDQAQLEDYVQGSIEMFYGEKEADAAELVPKPSEPV